MPDAFLSRFNRSATAGASARRDVALLLHLLVLAVLAPVLPRAAFYDYLQALVRAGLGKRVMFGSDQMRWPEKIGESIEGIEQAPFLTEEQQ